MAPKNRMVGNPGPIQQGIEADYDPKYGFNVRSPIRGRLDVIAGLASQIAAIGGAFTYRELGDGNAELISRTQNFPGSDPGTEIPVDGWQLLGNVSEKDLYRHPTLLAASDTDIIALQTGVETKSDTNVPAALKKYYQLLIRGVTHFTDVKYVVRHSQTVSSQYTKNIVDDNVFKIYSTAKLIAELNSFPKPPPARLINKITSIAAPAVQADYLWGWFKEPSTENTAANYKIEIVNDYELGQHSTVIYPNPVI